MANAETGLRGYLDDGDATLLAPYDGAQRQVSAAEAQLRVLLASPRITAPDQSRYARQEAAQDTALGTRWRYAAEVRAEPASLRISSLTAGKVLFDRVRAANAALGGTIATRHQAAPIVGEFTPAHGNVRLSCHVEEAAKEVVVTCADTGIGIPEADREHLFSRFFRASNATSQAIPGTGLGLAIVQAIVEVHHGRLTLDSAEGKGTTVTLRFPQA